MFIYFVELAIHFIPKKKRRKWGTEKKRKKCGEKKTQTKT